MKRTKKIRPNPPDLDTMSEAELAAFIAHRQHGHLCRRLLGMASLRVMYFRTNDYKYAHEFERRYRLLPPYAQWRRFFNPRAAALPGKRFRKHPPHQDRSGKWH